MWFVVTPGPDLPGHEARRGTACLGRLADQGNPTVTRNARKPLGHSCVGQGRPYLSHSRSPTKRWRSHGSQGPRRATAGTSPYKGGTAKEFPPAATSMRLSATVRRRTCRASSGAFAGPIRLSGSESGGKSGGAFNSPAIPRAAVQQRTPLLGCLHRAGLRPWSASGRSRTPSTPTRGRRTTCPAAGRHGPPLQVERCAGRTAR